MRSKKTRKLEKLSGKKKKSIKCWEFFKCDQKECPAYESKNLRCWLFSGTHCREKIQGKFIEKIELCLDCIPFKSNIDIPSLRNTLKVINKQLKEYKKIVKLRDKELESVSMELAIGLSETFEALKKISSGDNSLNLHEKSKIELIGKLKHVVNKTAKEIRKAEETMRFTQFAIDHTADSAFWMTSDARFIYVNNAACRSLGYSRRELLSMTKYDIDPVFTKKVWKDHWKDLKKRKTFQFESVHKAKDGRIFPVEVTVNFVEFKGREYNCAFSRDITKSKQMLEQIQESEEKYRKLFFVETDAVVLFDAETLLFTDVNDAASYIYGYTRDEFLKMNRLDISAKPVKSKESIQKILTGDMIWIPLDYHKKKNGTIFPVEISAGNFILKGRKIGFEVIKDITIRKQAEEAVRESEEKFRAISNTAADAIFLIDSKGKISYWNPTAARMFGYKSEEALGKELHMLLAPERYHEEYKRGFEIFQKTGKGRAIGNKLEFFAIRKDGTEFPIEVSTSSLKLGDKLCAVGIVRDVTFRKQAEEELRNAELRYRTVADFTHDWEYWEDPQGKLLYVSPSCERITGFRPEQFINKPHLIYQITVLEDQDNWGNHRHSSFEAMGQQSIIFRIKRRDGKIRWIEHVCQPIIDKQGTFLGIRASNRDITIRKHAEEELKKSYEKLRALTSRITEIEEVEKRKTARELHDQVGQNLTALSINLDFLIKHLSDESRTSIGSRLHDSKDLVKEIMKIVRNMMADLRPRILDDYGLAAAIHWYSDQFSKRTKIPVSFKGEEIELRLPSDIETNLFRIMQESLTNVAKHAHANKVSITLEEREGKIRLIITDNGIGFNPTRIKRSKKKGFGMIGMKERSEALGGTLHVESSSGKGTQVIVEIKR